LRSSGGAIGWTMTTTMTAAPESRSVDTRVAPHRHTAHWRRRRASTGSTRGRARRSHALAHRTKGGRTLSVDGRSSARLSRSPSVSPLPSLSPVLLSLTAGAPWSHFSRGSAALGDKHRHRARRGGDEDENEERSHPPRREEAVLAHRATSALPRRKYVRIVQRRRAGEKERKTRRRWSGPPLLPRVASCVTFVPRRCVASHVGARERKVVRAVNISLYRPRRWPRLPRTSIGSAVPIARVAGEHACRRAAAPIDNRRFFSANELTSQGRPGIKMIAAGRKNSTASE